MIGDEEQTLLLTEDAIGLVRDRLEAAIELYNEENDLTGEDAEEYPFSRGTAYELGFLEAVAGHVRVSVDDEVHPILDAVRRRFYDLGREGVVDSSVLVEVSPDGATFEPITDPAYAEYDVELFSDAGILEVDFPGGFFTDESAFRVAFDYTVTGGVFMLGLSIIPGSDRVSVNGAPLERDVDYMIDYEIGMLVLLIEVDETDVIRIDYERFAGGILGSATDYATYFYGLTLDWPISEHLTIEASLLRSAEDPGSVADPESVRTMPNRHTVAGVSGTISRDDFTGDFLVAYSNDRFPFDDNARIHRPNEIAAIAATEGYVFFGHRSGLTVKRADEWLHYGTSQGLAGRSVRAIAVGDETLFLGTNSGLTVVALEGRSPLDRVGNWSNYYAAEDEGLPDASVTALYYADGTLWVGTDDGLVSVAVDQIEETEGWTRYEDEVDLGAVTALAGDGEALFVGTEDSLYRYSLVTEKWLRMEGSAGIDVRDLSLSDGTLYVASGRGLRSYRDGIGTGWLVVGAPVHAVELFGGSVFYGTDGGLIDATAGAVVLADVPVTALEGDGGTLWIGGRANADYELTIRAYAEGIAAYGPSETGIAGYDPFGFVDAAAEEHTWEGFVERASFRHTAEGFTLSGRFENVSPSYRSIGNLSRSDSTGWDLAATWELSDEADVSFSHGYDISGRTSGDPESSMVNDLSLRWTFGPVLTFGAHQATSNDETGHEGPESTYTSYRFSLRDRFFAERLDLGISWSDGYTWSYGQGEPRRDTSLGRQEPVSERRRDDPPFVVGAGGLAATDPSGRRGVERHRAADVPDRMDRNRRGGRLGGRLHARLETGGPGRDRQPRSRAGVRRRRRPARALRLAGHPGSDVRRLDRRVFPRRQRPVGGPRTEGRSVDPGVVTRRADRDRRAGRAREREGHADRFLFGDRGAPPVALVLDRPAGRGLQRGASRGDRPFPLGPDDLGARGGPPRGAVVHADEQGAVGRPTDRRDVRERVPPRPSGVDGRLEVRGSVSGARSARRNGRELPAHRRPTGHRRDHDRTAERRLLSDVERVVGGLVSRGDGLGRRDLQQPAARPDLRDRLLRLAASDGGEDRHGVSVAQARRGTVEEDDVPSIEEDVEIPPDDAVTEPLDELGGLAFQSGPEVLDGAVRGDRPLFDRGIPQPSQPSEQLERDADRFRSVLWRCSPVHRTDGYPIRLVPATGARPSIGIGTAVGSGIAGRYNPAHIPFL